MTILEFYKEILAVRYTHLPQEDASYAFFRRGRTLFLYFEWSNGRTDWCNNLDFPAAEYGGDGQRHYAHRGFLRVFRAVEPILRPLICAKMTDRIRIGGYSHGAALALLCYEACLLLRPDIRTEIYGYGAVQETFLQFAVIRNGRDLVTHIPPALLGYRHAGRMIEVGKKTSLSPVEDHRPENYLRGLSDSRFGAAKIGEPLSLPPR